jgi:PAS domain S-box-containing protein
VQDDEVEGLPHDIRLGDVVDIEAILEIAESLNALTGYSFSIVDLNDEVLVRVGWQDACIRFHRANPESCQLCRESDTQMAKGVPRGETMTYLCKNGLWHAVTPLFVGDRYLANIFTSQFFFDDEEMDVGFFEEQAARFGYERDDYLAAIRAVPRYSRATIEALMHFYVRLAGQIAMLGLANWQLSETLGARERALEARMEIEERFSGLVESAPLPIAVVDFEGTITYLNEECTRVFGYTARDVPTVEEWYRRACPDPDYRAASAARWNADVALALSGDGRIPGAEYAVTCKNGDVRKVVISGAVVGKRILVIMEDVTERERGETLLLESQRVARVGHYEFDLARDVWDASEVLMDIFGIDESHVRDFKGFLQLVHPDDRSAVERYFVDEVVGHRSPFDKEYRIVRASNGAERWVHGLGTLTYDTAGAPLSLFGVIQDVTDRKRSEAAVDESTARLERMVYDVAEAMGRVAEARDPYTQGHQQRVALLAKRIAVRMGLSQTVVDEVEMAGLLHDVGKLRIPTEILTKPGGLSEAEFALVKDHPEQSHEILKGIAFPWAVAEIALQHQERMNGSGYPAGLKGEEMLPAARILAVADVVEAMASHRPYRPALGVEAAMEEIVSHPELYDGDVVAACVSLHADGELGL